MFSVGDVVEVISGVIFVGKRGVVVGSNFGFVQVKIYGYNYIYDFRKEELKLA